VINVAPNVRVVIFDYDPEWPRRFDEERHRIMETLGAPGMTVVHMGSTAVPGLGAKPIIDIMVGVRDRAEADQMQKALERIGYTDVTPEPDNSEWFYCLGYGTRELYHHVHLVVEGSRHWRRQLAFRDYLRSHPETAKEYNELKKRLANDYGENRVGYTDAKTGFIEGVLEKVEVSALDEAK
jgi:GrpB-like predicted nucleotidyltransferase (UPF0157 family)